MSVHEAEFVRPEKDGIESPKMLLWRVLIEPYRPAKTTTGGIELPEETLQNAALLSNIGRIVDMGELAYKEKTRSGLLLGDDPNLPQVGDWVLYTTNAGRRVQLRDGREYVIVNDDEILGKLSNPSLYKQWI